MHDVSDSRRVGPAEIPSDVSSRTALVGAHSECGSNIIGDVPQTHTAKALANPTQPHKALMHELERYIEAHWYLVKFEA